MRKLKPFNEFDRLTPDQNQAVHDRLVNSTLHKTMAFLSEQFGIAISYGRLQRYYHRWQQAEQIKAQTGVNIEVNELIAIQNGENIPLAPIAHHLILKSACIQAASEGNKPAQLLTLQRIANNQFNQEMAQAKNELEQRRQNLRAQELAFKQSSALPQTTPAQPAPNVIPLPPPAETHSSTPSSRTKPSNPSCSAAPDSRATHAQNPVSFEQKTLAAGPYIRDYSQISSFEKGPEPEQHSAVHASL